MILISIPIILSRIILTERKKKVLKRDIAEYQGICLYSKKNRNLKIKYNKNQSVYLVCYKTVIWQTNRHHLTSRGNGIAYRKQRVGNILRNILQVMYR